MKFDTAASSFSAFKNAFNMRSSFRLSTAISLCALLLSLGSIGCGKRVALTGPLAINSFVATPAVITPGQSTTLTWSVSLAAVHLTLNDGTSNLTVPTITPLNGYSVSVTPTAATTNYTLTATDGAGKTMSQIITVTAVPLPTITSFTASSAIIASGQPVTLNWATTGTSFPGLTSIACHAQDQGCGSIDGGAGLVFNGTSAIFTPVSTATYTLYAISPAGTLLMTPPNPPLNPPGYLQQMPVPSPPLGTFAFAKVTVTVIPTPAILGFTALPPVIGPGIPCSTLLWNVTGTTTAMTITDNLDSNVINVLGLPSYSVCPAQTTTYTLNATNVVNAFPATAMQSVTVTVSPNPPPFINSFTVTPPSVASGAAATLDWNVAGATTLTIECVSPSICDFNGSPQNTPVTVTGTSAIVNPTVSTTYELQATNANGNAAPAQVRVLVGDVALVAGSPNGITGFLDSPAVPALFNVLNGITADSSGNLYMADTNNSAIRKITPSGIVSTFAGNYTAVAGNNNSPLAGTRDGSTQPCPSAQCAEFTGPKGVAFDSTTGNFYVADTANSTIRMITPAGVVSTIAGLAGTQGDQNTDPQGDQVLFNTPVSVAVDSAGTLYIADSTNCDIRKITTPSTTAINVNTLAGGLFGLCAYQEGIGTGADFNQPEGVAVDGNGNVYIADTVNNDIRKITPDGTTILYAGNQNQQPGHADGIGTAASFSGPAGITVDAAGVLYVTDTGNSTIRRITPTPDGSHGIVSTIIGTYGASFVSPFAGGAFPYIIPEPNQITVDPTSGNLFFTTSADIVSAPY